MSIADGFTAFHLNSDMFKRATGPVLMIDDFVMSKPTFPPHPHAGISAVTYVLPDSKGAHVSYDSMGNVVSIKPGDLHWFCAGRGAVHTEQPEDAPVHGLQLFINLPIKSKRIEPFALHLNAEDIPNISNGSVTTRVVLGCYSGVSSPLRTPTPIMLLDSQSHEQDAHVDYSIEAGWAGMLYVLRGKIEACTEAFATTVYAEHALGFESVGDVLHIKAQPDSQWVILFGEALHESYELAGPIIMESQSANQERFAAYANGEFGVLSNYPG